MRWVSIAAVVLLPVVGMAESRLAKKAPRLQPPAIQLQDEASGAAIEIESTSVAFGEVVPGDRRELPSAIVIRVRSSHPWALRLAATAPLADLEKGTAVDWSRIQWRRGSGSFLPLVQGSAVVARGSATTPAGELITIDLSLGFGENDPVGQYACPFRVTLDSF